MRGILFTSPENGDMSTLAAALMSALPGGWRNNNNGNFNNLGNNANFWSSTENNSNNAWKMTAIAAASARAHITASAAWIISFAPARAITAGIVTF
ncbi:hypothetical protein EH223_20395 [candidate division KSB1 bacterium]|nr:MAG: hypothetical protein EH223_20395 [candidate division KSB1 bacterium]